MKKKWQVSEGREHALGDDGTRHSANVEIDVNQHFEIDAWGVTQGNDWRADEWQYPGSSMVEITADWMEDALEIRRAIMKTLQGGSVWLVTGQAFAVGGPNHQTTYNWNEGVYLSAEAALARRDWLNSHLRGRDAMYPMGRDVRVREPTEVKSALLEILGMDNELVVGYRGSRYHCGPPAQMRGLLEEVDGLGGSQAERTPAAPVRRRRLKL